MALENVRAWIDGVVANSQEEIVVMRRARAKLLKARAAAAKRQTTVEAHSRKGSGVKQHKRKLNPKEEKAAIAQDLLK